MSTSGLRCKLARDAEALSALKAKVRSHRQSFPLFDTKRFTRHLEAALVQMWERHQQGLPPQTFAVVPQ